ncbi:MAG: hypothetical protein U0S36_14400 [Candidatus Nanopelagicales bacterium]
MTLHETLLARAEAALSACGATVPSGEGWTARSPIDGSALLVLGSHGAADVEAAIGAAHEAFLQWRTVPAPPAATS